MTPNEQFIESLRRGIKQRDAKIEEQRQLIRRMNEQAAARDNGTKPTRDFAELNRLIHEGWDKAQRLIDPDQWSYTQFTAIRDEWLLLNSGARDSKETNPRITLMDDGRAMGGSDVCHTCEAHCTVIEDLQAALKFVLRERITLHEGAFFQRAESNAPDPRSGWYSFPSMPDVVSATLHQTRDLLQAKTTAPQTILDRKVIVCAACLCACCWQCEFVCAKRNTISVEKTIRELYELSRKGVREDSGFWFKDANTGKVDYDAKSAALRAWHASNEGSDA